MAILVRLYLVCANTNKKIESRSYASIEDFNKYGIKTYERHNRFKYHSSQYPETRQLLTYYEDGKWIEFDKKYIPDLIEGNLSDD